MKTNHWMSWEGGVDLVALTQANLEMPNVIVHVARMVHTPVGSAPSGMILLPNEDGSPKVMGFISTNAAVCDYFAPNIFAGTPFEQAPSLQADFDFFIDAPQVASVKISVAGHEVELQLSELGDLHRVNRQSPNLPFHDDSLEAAAASVSLKVDGEPLNILIPPMGMSGGPAAVYAAAGIYSR